MKDTLLIRP